MFSTLKKSLSMTSARVAAFAKANKGSVSVEFAFIMPLLITLYLGTMEVSEGIEVNKKVGRSASTIGDLLTQEIALTPESIKAILNVGNSQLLPYMRSVPTFKIVGVNIDGSGSATVAWSMQKVGNNFTTPLDKDAAYTLPAKLVVDDTFVVEVSTSLEYLPLTSWSIQKNKGTGDAAYAAVDMKETYYFRPRQEQKLECSTCEDDATP